MNRVNRQLINNRYPEIVRRMMLEEAMGKYEGGASIMEMEEFVKTRGLELGRAMLELLMQNDSRVEETKISACVKCGKHIRILEEKRQRTLNTLVGEVSYMRPYGVCDRCGLSYAPMDQQLGIPPHGMSMGLRQRISHAAVCCRSFESAADVVKEHDAIRVSHKTVRIIAEGEGKELIERRQAEVDSYKRHERIEAKNDVAELMVVACDGGRIQTRQCNKDERWKEDKVGVVYDALPQRDTSNTFDQYTGATAQTKTYVATMESWEAMGWMLRVEAEKRGYAQAKEKIFLADGARTIREVKQLQFPEAHYIIDWCHVVGHLADSAKAAFGEGTQKAANWYVRHKEKLWQGEVDDILIELQKLSKKVGLPQKGDTDTCPRVILDRNAHSYFLNNKDAMNYPYFRSRGWPIGSGAAEGGVKQFALRLKGSEKFWNVNNTGADEMLALCALYYSEDGRWQRYWQHRGQPYQSP